MSQPDRDEPRRFIIIGNRHGRRGQLSTPLVEVVEGPPIQMGERVEVVESREPFPSDEDALQVATAGVIEATGGALTQDEAEFYARAVLDAVSSHRDEDEDSAGAECSRLEDDMLEIHDALVDAGLPGTINAQNIIERINALASHRDDEAREESKTPATGGKRIHPRPRASHARRGNRGSWRAGLRSGGERRGGGREVPRLGQHSHHEQRAGIRGHGRLHREVGGRPEGRDVRRIDLIGERMRGVIATLLAAGSAFLIVSLLHGRDLVSGNRYTPAACVLGTLVACIGFAFAAFLMFGPSTREAPDA